MKARNSLVVLMVFFNSYSFAGIPGNKRTIYTTGEKVYPIRYHLGQSTVIDLGVKPEVVICGNKNYFNIEKLKRGITIQPLSQYSTNLTVLSGQKRFLFYLAPAISQNPDGFVDVKWVDPNERRPIRNLEKNADTQIELNEVIKIGPDIEISVIKLKVSSDKRRKILELSVKNKSSNVIQMSTFEILAFDAKNVVINQALAWEKDILGVKSVVAGRLIILNSKAKSLIMTVRFKNRIIKFKLKEIIN